MEKAYLLRLSVNITDSGTILALSIDQIFLKIKSLKLLQRTVYQYFFKLLKLLIIMKKMLAQVLQYIKATPRKMADVCDDDGVSGESLRQKGFERTPSCYL